MMAVDRSGMIKVTGNPASGGFNVPIKTILREHCECNRFLPDDWYANIRTWATWYAGSTPFHKYKIYNGQRFVDCARKTLGMAKKMSEDKADLLLSEKVEIAVTKSNLREGEKDNGELQAKIDDVLKSNFFRVRGNQLVEVSQALGTGAFVEYMDGDSVAIDYIPATMIYPIEWTKRNVTGCAFVSVSDFDEKRKRVFVSKHIKEGEQYVVYNYAFLVDQTGDITSAELSDGVLDRWATGCPYPCFQFITPNVVNNIDLSNPMGVSVFGNSIDVLEAVDLAFDSFVNEFVLGKKRIFVDSRTLNINPLAEGSDSETVLPLFDSNDTTFYALPYSDTTQTRKPIEESNMELRIEDHKTGIQTMLDMLSDKAGFGKGYYKFDVSNAQTATAVVSEGSKLFRNIQKESLIIEAALENMTTVILYLLGIKDGYDISVSFDDSIIEDTNAIANRALLELNSGVIDKVEYLCRVYDMSEGAAIAKVAEMDARAAVRTEEMPPDDDNAFSGA